MMWVVSGTASAQVYVDSVADFITAIRTAAEGSTIKFSDNFVAGGYANNFTVVVNNVSTNNFTIDGELSNAAPIVLNAAVGPKHLDLKKATNTGTITLKNIRFKGLRTASDIASAVNGASGGGVVVDMGTYVFDNVAFSAISGRGLRVMTNASARVVASTFEDNIVMDGGAAILASGNLAVDQSTFSNNNVNGLGYSGGAILLDTANRGLTITRSVFLNNSVFIRGGAVAAHNATNATITIDNSYFEGNSTYVNSNQGSTHDGGAVSVFSGSADSGIQFALSNSTFYKNYAYDDAGAVFLENRGATASNTITNCTMVQNSSSDYNPTMTSGGAVQISLNTTLTIESSTIIENYINNLPGGLSVNGGGLGYHTTLTAIPRYVLKNNIILGNYAQTSSGIVTNAFSNVGLKWVIQAGLTDNGGNIGVDNGTALPAGVDLETVFGNPTPVLWENLNDEEVGNPNATTAGYHRILPTVSILPDDGVDVTGLANGTAVIAAPSTDGRKYARSTTAPDVGAVEIFWAKFDANGGAFSGIPAAPYTGVSYCVHSGSDAVKYFQISRLGGAVTTATKPANPTKAGSVFVGWKDASSSAMWDGVTPITLSDNVTLLAQWQAGGGGGGATAIPTLSEKSLAVLVLLMLMAAAGAAVHRRRQS